MNDRQGDFTNYLSSEEPKFYLEIKFPSFKEEHDPVVVGMISAAIKEYFRENASNKNREWHYNVISSVWEAVKNGLERGNGLDPLKSVFLEIKFWKDKVSVGVGDEGGFYENTLIQKLVSEKQIFPKDLAHPHPNSCGWGMGMIYAFASKVFVEKGKLIMVFKRQVG